MRRPFLTILVAVALAVPAGPAAPVPTAARAPDGQPDGPPDRVARVHLPTSCGPDAQAHIDRGVALLHAFWFAPAREAFAAAARADPGCGMAHWGTAMAWLDNPLDGPAPPAAVLAGRAAVAQARATGAPTQRERDYLAAIGAFYEAADPEAADPEAADPEAADPGAFRTRALAYAQRMAHLYRTYPADREAAVFYALALNLTASPTDATFAAAFQAARILDAVAAAQPDHPAVAHYLIHSYDHPTLAPLGRGAARGYARLAPAGPHARHVPSHIFSRLGDWQASIDANRGALAAARAAAGPAAPGGAPAETLHPLDFLAYAYLQTAQDERARDVLDAVAAFQQAPERPGEAAARAAIPARYALERGRWRDAAALTLHPSGGAWDRFPQAEAVTVFARGLGAARSGDVAGARRDADRLDALREALVAARQSAWAEQVDLQRQAVLGWIAWAEGRDHVAVALLRGAADREDATDTHAGGPGPLAPARELLGELLLELDAPAEALAAFEAAHAAEPNRFRGRYGAAWAAQLAGDVPKARAHYTALVALGAHADTERAELRYARAFVARQGPALASAGNRRRDGSTDPQAPDRHPTGTRRRYAVANDDAQLVLPLADVARP